MIAYRVWAPRLAAQVLYLATRGVLRLNDEDIDTGYQGRLSGSFLAPWGDV